MAKAEEYFNSMTAATPESKWGLGVIAITKGEYDKAVNLFGTEPCFNLALAQVLKGDVNKAKSTLDSMKELCKCGKPSYLKAVVGARLDDKNYMINSLKEAIGFKADWKAYAKTDLEFAKFFNDDTFKSTSSVRNISYNIKRLLSMKSSLFLFSYSAPTTLFPHLSQY